MAPSNDLASAAESTLFSSSVGLLQVTALGLKMRKSGIKGFGRCGRPELMAHGGKSKQQNEALNKVEAILVKVVSPEYTNLSLIAFAENRIVLDLYSIAASNAQSNLDLLLDSICVFDYSEERG